MSEIHIPEVPGPPAPPAGGFLYRVQPLLTLLIALVAIGLAFWEGVENRRHNRLTVKPSLGAEIQSGRDGNEQFVRMAIEATGLGPAVIGTFRIYFDGVPQDSAAGVASTRWDKVIAAVADSVTQVNAHALGAGYYFLPGRRYVLFEARRPTADSAFTSTPLAAILDRLAVQICYCSVYGTDCGEELITSVSIEPLACRS